MTPERWQRARQVLNEALEREPNERGRFLAEACSGDESLRQEVEALVMAHEQAGSFLGVPRPELWRRAEELFHAALDQSPEARRAFFDSACGQDTELRRQVDLLVSADENAGSFLDKAGVADLTATSSAGGSAVVG